MPIKISVNTGFITNSSSVVHGFDQELLEDPDVAAFIQTYGMSEGFVGDVWYRSETTFAVTPEQKQEVREAFSTSEFSSRSIPGDNDDDSVIIVYGDEYETITSELANLLYQASQRLGRGNLWSFDFN